MVGIIYNCVIITNNCVIITNIYCNYILKFYLVENKVYSINKDKTLGELFGDYIDEKVVVV